MNHLIIGEVVYHFQDLVSQKKVKTFTKFLGEINIYFKISDVDHKSYKFIYNELKNMHTFLKEIQHHPNSHLLSQALKPLFGFLLDNIVIPKVVCVFDKKIFHIFRIKYSDLILAAQKRRLIQKEGGIFVVPYKGEISLQLRKEMGILPPKNWVMRFVARRITEKLELSLGKYGGEVLNPWRWCEEKRRELSARLALDYLNSDSDYLPPEIFELELSPDIPEGR